MRVTLPRYIFDGYFQNGLFVSGTQPGTITPTNVGGTMYAIIQPQQIAAGNTVVRVTTSSNNVYDLTYNANVEFIAGITTILEVDMKQTPGMLSANVTDWVTGNTIPFTPTPITVSGTLNNTSDFFRGKTIHIYKYGATNAEFETFTYSYLRNTDGTGYSWNGRQLYWDNYVGQTLNVTSIYNTMQSMIPPAVDATTISFPWNLPANQSGGYSNYDILSTKMGLLQPTMINFNFIHPLSKVRVEIKSDEFTSAELAGASVILNNIVLTGIINLPSGTASPSGTPAATIVPQTDAEGSKYSALVMPSTVAAGTTIVTVRLVEYPNVAFTGSLSTDLTFVAGKEHLLTVTLRRTEAQLSATYEEWTDGDSGEITIE